MMDETCSMHRRSERCIQYFGWKTYKAEPLGRISCRWEDNIRMDLKVILWKGVDRIHLAQYRDQWRVLVNTVNLRVS